MTHKDSLQRFLFDNAPIRGEFIYLHESFQTIVHQHNYPPSIKRLLGEMLCVAGLLSAIIKFDGRLTVQFRGKGRLKLLLAQCDSHNHLRGLAKWDGDLNYNDLMHAFKKGVLVIMLDAGMKSQYQGIVSWRSNSLVESIEGYFRESEQLATKIWLNVDDQSASGFLLQMMPGEKKEDNMEALKGNGLDPEWVRITKLASHLDAKTMLNADYLSLLDKIYPEEEIRVFPAVPLSFHCTCSRKRGEDAIRLLGKEEAEAEIKDKQTIVVTCDFCNKEYIFDHSDIDKLFSNPPSQFH